MALSRRHVLAAGGASLFAARPAFASATALRPTDSITNVPEYIPGAPMRSSFLEDAASGERIRVFGRAVTPTGEPLAHARLDFWHTDSQGVYDVSGYKFRGRQRTDRRGRFVLDTVMPGSYGNPLHIHFLIVARGQPQPRMLSGAIYFPTEKEYADHADLHPLTEFLPPDTIPVVDGVRMAHCDIVVEPEPPTSSHAALTPTFGWSELTDYYGWLPGRPGPPFRASLIEPEDAGERIAIGGRACTRAGAPLADARLEFWNADAAGPYDRVGYRLRGVQRTRPDGGYMLETVIPRATGGLRRIDYLASAVPPGRHQPLYVHAAIFLANNAERAERVTPDMRNLVRPGARTYGEDSAFLALDALPIENGVRRAHYDIVFDIA